MPNSPVCKPCPFTTRKYARLCHTSYQYVTPLYPLTLPHMLLESPERHLVYPHIHDGYPFSVHITFTSFLNIYHLAASIIKSSGDASCTNTDTQTCTIPTWQSFRFPFLKIYFYAEWRTVHSFMYHLVMSVQIVLLLANMRLRRATRRVLPSAIEK